MLYSTHTLYPVHNQGLGKHEHTVNDEYTLFIIGNLLKNVSSFLSKLCKLFPFGTYQLRHTQYRLVDIKVKLKGFHITVL